MIFSGRFPSDGYTTRIDVLGRGVHVHFEISARLVAAPVDVETVVERTTGVRRRDRTVLGDDILVDFVGLRGRFLEQPTDNVWHNDHARERQ